MRSLGTTVVALALIGPASAHAAAVRATLTDPTPVASFRGVSAWSERVPGGGGFRLVVARSAQAPQALPIASRGVPFDVDLGPGSDGGVVAVYSRCEREPPLSLAPPVPVYTAGRGCDLYRFDLDGDREAPLPGASTDAASEVLPSIWRDEVAFARVYQRRGGRRDGLELGVLPYLYVRRLDGEGGSRRQPGDVRGSTGVPGPRALDLYGRRLGFVWQVEGRGETPGFRARVVTGGEGSRVVAGAGGGGLSRSWLASATFDRGRFLFGVSCFGDPGGCRDAGLRDKLVRFTLSTGRLEAAPLPGAQLVALAVDGGRAVTVRERLTGAPAGQPTCTAIASEAAVPSVCEVLELAPDELVFEPAPRALGSPQASARPTGAAEPLPSSVLTRSAAVASPESPAIASLVDRGRLRVRTSPASTRDDAVPPVCDPHALAPDAVVMCSGFAPAPARSSTLSLSDGTLRGQASRRHDDRRRRPLRRRTTGVGP